MCNFYCRVWELERVASRRTREQRLPKSFRLACAGSCVSLGSWARSSCHTIAIFLAVVAVMRGIFLEMKIKKVSREEENHCGKPLVFPYHFKHPIKPQHCLYNFQWTIGFDKKEKRPSDADRPSERKGEQNIPRDRKKKTEAAPKRELAKRSTLRASKNWEALFSWGSGSILTPLFRHILNGAARDILFRTKNMRAKSDKKPKREELRGDKQAKKDESMKGEQRGIKAEGLSYKVGPTLPIITSSS